MNKQLSAWFAQVDLAEPLQQLASWRLQRIGSAFRFLRDTVLSEAPANAQQSGFAAACAVLDRTTLRDMRLVLDYPGFELWLDRCLDLISRRAHVRLPQGTTLAHLSALTTFAVAVADPGTRLRVRVEADGLVHLRATGRVLEFPAAAAGTWVSVHRDETGEIAAEPGCSPRVVELPRTGVGWELNRVDRLLSRRPRPVPGSVLDVGAADATERAWELMSRVVPDYLAELRAFQWVVVPVATHRPETRARLGLWELPVGLSVPEMAAELVVAADEARVALVVEHILTSSGHHPRWPRIERAVRRAVRGVAGEAYWRSCVPALTGAAREVARRRTEQCQRLRAEAAAAIRELPELPSEAQKVLSPLYDRRAAGALVSRRPVDTGGAQLRSERRQARIPEEDARRATRFGSAWRAAGGVSRDRYGGPMVLPAAGLGAVGQLAGIAEGVAVNVPYGGVDRADGSLDRLGLASIRDPGLVERLREKVAVRLVTDDPLDHMIRGHLSYVSGDMDDAARHYATAARMVPENIDFWHDLAFALLHLGKRESRVFRFAPDLLVHAASGVQPDAFVARRVAGEPDTNPPVTDVDDLTCMVLILRAVDRAARLDLI